MSRKGDDPTMSDPYAEAWAARRDLDPVVDESEPTVSEREDPKSDRDRYLTLLVDVDPGPARDALAAVAADLDRFDALRALPPRWFHVTVTELGFVVDDPTGPREIDADTADRVADRIGDALADAAVEPFELCFPRLNLWPRVVFCEARDDGSLAALHRAVLGVPGVPVYEYDGGSYTPHLTVAHFVDDAGTGAVVDWLEANRSVGVDPLRVDSLRLVADDPTTAERTYETVREYPL